MKLLGIELSFDEFDYLMCEQAKGKELKVVDGKVVAVDYEITEEYKVQKRIAELKQLLESQDYKTIKYVQGELSEEEFSKVKTQCKVWRDEINKLEA